MATITHRLGRFTGSVGPVRFNAGAAETEDADMLAYFRADADTYDVDAPEPIELPDEAPRTRAPRTRATE